MMDRLALGRTFYGVAVIGTGILQLVTANFMRLVPQLPAWVPVPHVLACMFGAILIVIGLAILSGRGFQLAVNGLAAMITVNLVVLYLPQMIWNDVVDRPYLRGFMYTNPLKQLALIGGLAILAARVPGSLPIGVAKLAPRGALLLAVFLIVCGVQHIVYVAFVAEMVPTWIPLSRRFWVYVTATALMAGGAGILTPKWSRLAADLSALMIFSWVFLVHIPRAVSLPAHALETSGVFEALALSGVALMVSATRNAAPPQSR